MKDKPDNRSISCLEIERLPIDIKPDITRVLLRPYAPGNDERITKIISRVLLLSDDEAEILINKVLHDFSSRHIGLEKLFLSRYEGMKKFVLVDKDISETRKLLIGSYFLSEYALESAAIFNPSMVLHPDQSKLPVGSLRYILSLRSTGEGHISSISFRVCVIDENGDIEFSPTSKVVQSYEPVSDQHYNKETFSMKLFELGLAGEFSHTVLSQLDLKFTFLELEDILEDEILKQRGVNSECEVKAEEIRVLAKSNFRISFDPSLKLSEKIIFPHSDSQRKGIEDARFTRFIDEDGSVTYYATFTAYDGKIILPQLLETKDFKDFHIMTLNGKVAENKGMALFPRKLNGKYYMLSRQDNENIFLMTSDNIHFWHNAQRISQPSYPWEFVQLGNCGPPIETEKGWLVLSHGVGPMRKYCIGAFLLDLKDPSKLIGHLKEPLISPVDDEREGYVPNVVYSCGAVVHGKHLVIPYAYSDFGSRIARIELSRILKMVLE